MSLYRLARQADEDLEEIAAWIAQASPDAAERILDALHATFVSLARQSGIGQTRDDLRPRRHVFPARAPDAKMVTGGRDDVADLRGLS